MGHVIIGMDPHKRSATIEVIDGQEKVLAQGRFVTDRDGYKAMLAAGRGFPDRTWAVEGCGGIGRHIAQRLVADGESVAGVPAKLSALRTQGLQVVAADGATVALRLLADRRDGLGHARTDTVNRLQRLLPGITARRGEEVPVRPAGPRPGGNRAAA
jgi:transposase